MKTFIPNCTIYCKTPEIKEKVRAYAKELNSKCKMPDQIQIIEPVKNALNLPVCVENVLNGYGYPSKEECTPDEQKILYNPVFISLYQTYQKIQDPTKKEQIKKSIAEVLAKGNL